MAATTRLPGTKAMTPTWPPSRKNPPGGTVQVPQRGAAQLLAFLPTAEDDIQQPLTQVTDGDQLQLHNIATDTYDLVLSALEFAQVTSDDKAADILLGLNKMGVNKLRLPEPFHSPVDILNNHIALILREQPIVNRLLENIEAIPVAERLDDITNLLNEDQQQSDAVYQRYHFYMLVFSVLLVLVLVYLAIRLMRSYTEISRVNKALQTANDDLELRVEERTRELRDTQSELLDTARQAGMAEIATNVLHNVGNVLNSVNISADLVTRKLRSSKALGLGKAMQLINEHPADLGSFQRGRQGQITARLPQSTGGRDCPRTTGHDRRTGPTD